MILHPENQDVPPQRDHYEKESVVFQAPFLRDYCSWKKSCTTREYENCDVSHLNWSAGFFPSTVWGSLWGSTISPAKQGKPWNICQILPSTLRNGSWRVPMPALHYLRPRKALIKWLLGFILKWGTEDLNLSLGNLRYLYWKHVENRYPEISIWNESK